MNKQLRAAAPVGAPSDLLRNAAVWDSTFTPTIIAPFRPKNTNAAVSKLFFWWHLLVQCTCLGIVGTACAGTFHWQKITVGCDPLDESCFKQSASVFTSIIGWVTLVCCAMYIIMILISASVWSIDQARREVEYHIVLWFFLCCSMVGSFWVYIQSARALTSVAFYLCTAAVITQVYAGTLLYSCVAAMKMVTVSRVVVPAFSTALSILIACAVQMNDISFGDDWTTGEPLSFSYGQKFCSFLVPSFQLAGILSMIVLRRITSNENGISQLEESPFVRTTILFAFFFAACTNCYVYSFVRTDTDMASGMLGIASLLLSSFSVLVVFQANAKGEYADSKYDWERVEG